MPIRRVGRRFVGTLGYKLRGVWNRLWNSEQFIIFQTVILQRAQYVTASHAIRQRIENHLDAWVEDKHAMLVKDTLCTCSEYLTVAWIEETLED